MLYFAGVTNFWSWVFLGMLIAVTATQMWLAQRQIAHVRKHRDTVPSMFAGAIPLPSHQKAADYSIAKAHFEIAGILLGALVLLLFTLGGLIDWFDKAWKPLFGRSTLAHGVALCASVAFVSALLDLPMSICRTFVLEARFGFNRVTPRLFVADLLKQAALAALFGIPLLFIVLWLMDAMGELWWLYVWAVWIGFNILVLFLFPTVIAPLFNKFTPLRDPELAERVEGLLRRCGFRSRGLYVMDGSKRSSHGNAYFTGFGPAKRIVFFDTLLARLTSAEIEAAAHPEARPPAVCRFLRAPLGTRSVDRPTLVLRRARSLYTKPGSRVDPVHDGRAYFLILASAAFESLFAAARVRSRRIFLCACQRN
jgi:STE24 endopeptidase